MKGIIVGFSGLVAVVHYRFNKSAIPTPLEKIKEKEIIEVEYEDENDEDDEDEEIISVIHHGRCANSNVKLDPCYRSPLKYKFT